MRRKPNIFILVFTMILINLIVPAKEVVAFDFSKSEWEKPVKDIALDLKLINEEMATRSNAYVTREEFSEMITKLYEAITMTEIRGRKTFTDTNNIFVEKAAYLGVVNGMNANKFYPKSELTREQATVMIDRLIAKLNFDIKEKNVKTFNDENKFSPWAKNSIYSIYRKGIMQGVGNNNFEPDSKYTRNQSIITIIGVYRKYNESKLDNSTITNSINSLKTIYPTGTKWNNDDYRNWNAGLYSGGYGCSGFAFMASDKAFGALPARIHIDFDNIRVGDVVRVNNDTHAVIVIGINGDSYKVAEGNYGGRVHWGRTFTLDQIKNMKSYIITRYP